MQNDQPIGVGLGQALGNYVAAMFVVGILIAAVAGGVIASLVWLAVKYW